MEGEDAIDLEAFPKLSVKQPCLQPNHRLKSCLDHRCRGKGAIVLRALSELPFEQASSPPLAQLLVKQAYLPPNNQLKSFQLQHLCWYPSPPSSSHRRGLLPASFVFSNQTTLAFRSHQSILSASLVSCSKVACIAHRQLEKQPRDPNLATATSRPQHRNRNLATIARQVNHWIPTWVRFVHSRLHMQKSSTCLFIQSYNSSLPHSICTNTTVQFSPSHVNSHLNS